MKVGVLLPSRFGDPGEFLADARAMEAAGVDSVWMDELAPELDPMLALVAIAAVTSNIRLGVLNAEHRETDLELDRRIESLQRLSRRRLVPTTERWQRVEAPAGREEWARILEGAEPEIDGVVVPMDPRLLDILRHPNEAIDRQDLVLAQG